MLPKLDYLAWAQRYYPQLRFDLATSGLSPVLPEELGEAPPPDDLGMFERFRRQVAARYEVSPGEVSPVMGASGGIFAAYHALLKPGDEVLIEQPTYEPVVRVAEGLGLKVRRFQRGREQRYEVDPQVVAAALTPRTRAVVVTDTHNPSGIAADHEALAEVAERLDAQNALLIVDEVYAGLIQPGRTARHLGPNVIAFGSLTKCYGVGWARAGYLLAPAAMADSFAELSRHICGALPPSCVSWGTRAMSCIEDLDKRRVQLQDGKRARVDAWLAQHPQLSWEPPPDSSLFGFVHDARGEDLRPALERGVGELGVLAAAGSFFDAPAGFRLAWTLPSERLDEALSRLGSALGL